MNHRYEIEGHTVWLLGDGPYRRFFCDCETFKDALLEAWSGIEPLYAALQAAA